MDESTDVVTPPARGRTSLAVGMLALALVFGAAGGYRIAGVPAGVAARVNGEAITNSELSSELRVRFGNEVLQDLVNRDLILQAARQEKIEITPAETDARIEKMKEDPQVQSLVSAGKVTDVDLRRNLVTLMPLDKLAEKRITSEDEKQYLLEHREELETIRVSHIVVSSAIEANAVLHRLQKPRADFAKLAGDCSLDPQTRNKGGDLGELHRSQMEPKVAEILFALKPGELSPIVQTQMGFHVFKLEAHHFEYATLQPAIHAILVDAKRGEVLEELRAKAHLEVSKPYHLAEIPSTDSPSPGQPGTATPELDKS